MSTLTVDDSYLIYRDNIGHSIKRFLTIMSRLLLEVFTAVCHYLMDAVGTCANKYRLKPLRENY